MRSIVRHSRHGMVVRWRMEAGAMECSAVHACQNSGCKAAVRAWRCAGPGAVGAWRSFAHVCRCNGMRCAGMCSVQCVLIRTGARTHVDASGTTAGGTQQGMHDAWGAHGKAALIRAASAGLVPVGS